jgi:hypothetical protein
MSKTSFSVNEKEIAGPDRRQERRIEKRGETGILEKAEVEESCQDDGMDRRMK